jgi:hypothetical protein
MGPPPALDGWLKRRGLVRWASARSGWLRPRAGSRARPPRRRSCRALGQPAAPREAADAVASRAKAAPLARQASDAGRDGSRARRDASREPCSCRRQWPRAALHLCGARSARAHPRRRPTKHGPQKLVASAAMLTAAPATGAATGNKFTDFAEKLPVPGDAGASSARRRPRRNSLPLRLPCLDTAAPACCRCRARGLRRSRSAPALCDRLRSVSPSRS